MTCRDEEIPTESESGSLDFSSDEKSVVLDEFADIDRVREISRESR